MKNVKAGNLSTYHVYEQNGFMRQLQEGNATWHSLQETSSIVLSLPSHFVRDSLTIGAMDNFDHNEATLSGLNSCHDTVLVLFQEVPRNFPNTPKVAETNISRRTKQQLLQLPYQTLSKFHRLPPPLVLPTTFKCVTDLYQYIRITDVKQKDDVIVIMQAVNVVKEHPEPAGTWGAICSDLRCSLTPEACWIFSYTSVFGYRLQQCIYVDEKLQRRAVKIGPGIFARCM